VVSSLDNTTNHFLSVHHEDNSLLTNSQVQVSWSTEGDTGGTEHTEGVTGGTEHTGVTGGTEIQQLVLIRTDHTHIFTF